MTTDQPPYVLGQKRRYAYEPLILETTAVYEDLSWCEYAAAETLNVIDVQWNRLDQDLMHIAFSPVGGTETYLACCSLRPPDDYDEEASDDYPPLAGFFDQKFDWVYECQITRTSDRTEVTDDLLFVSYEGRAVYIRDVLPAIRATSMAVSHASECIIDLDTLTIR